MRRLFELLVILSGAAAAYIWFRKSQYTGEVTIEEVVNDAVSDAATTVQKTVDKVTKRGIRNNNPGNIIFDGQQWQGLAQPASDGKFCIFISPNYGFRALGKILTNYQARYGINTIRGIISRWSETDQAAYIDNVSRWTGLGPDQPINIRDWLGALAAAITRQENGYNPYAQSDIEEWVRLA